MTIAEETAASGRVDPLQAVPRAIVASPPTGDPGSSRAISEPATAHVAIYQRQASLLQAAFLPATLPPTPGLDVAAAYLPASGEPMGGDWYDVFPVGGMTCLVLGDVAGHGLAAASLMGQLRNAARAYAMEDPSPGHVLDRLNRFLCWADPDVTATAIVATWDPTRHTITRANAGHPPPLRCRAGEFAYLVPPAEHRLLGLEPHRNYVEEEKTLRDGTTLLFYSDGLIEERHRAFDNGMMALLEYVKSLGDLAPLPLCDALVSWRYERWARDDDMCILAVRTAVDDGPVVATTDGRGRLPLRWN